MEEKMGDLRWIFSGVGGTILGVLLTYYLNYLTQKDKVDVLQESHTITQTTIEYETVNIKVKGTFEECENSTATVTYLVSSVVDSPEKEKPVKYIDEVIVAQIPNSKIVSHKFTPKATVLNKDQFKRNPTFLRFEIINPDAKSKLFGTGEIVVNQQLAKKQGGIGLRIPYDAQYLIVNIDISEAPFIRDYNWEAKLKNRNETKTLEPIVHESSMTYTFKLEDTKANSEIAFEWKNDY